MGWTEELRSRWTYQVDHAAKNETSIMMHVCPQLVDLSQLSKDRAVWPQGVNGQDPRDATAAFAKERMEETLEYVREMLGKAGV